MRRRDPDLMHVRRVFRASESPWPGEAERAALSFETVRNRGVGSFDASPAAACADRICRQSAKGSGRRMGSMLLSYLGRELVFVPQSAK